MKPQRVGLRTVQSALVLSIAVVSSTLLNAGESFTNFITGGTMSHVPQRETAGFVYKNAAGTAESPYKTLKANGAKYAAFDLWTGSSDRAIAQVKLEAKRAKDEGLKVLINFFYSDNYDANIPAGWPTDITALRTKVYDYTYDVLSQLTAAGASADIVKIGNEIDGRWRDGFLNPTGKKSTNYANFVALLKEGIAAVRAYDSTIPICIHSAEANAATNVTFYSDLIANGVSFDVIALSAYLESSYTFPTLISNLDTLAANFSKKILIVETAYAWTSTDFDSKTNRYADTTEGHAKSQTGAYTYYARMIDIVAATAGNKGVGVLHWPTAYTAYTGMNSTGDASAFWHSTTAQSVACATVLSETVTIGTGLGGMAQPTTTSLVNETFDAGTTGSAPSGWTMTLPNSTSGVIVEDPSTSNKSLRLTDSTTSAAAVAVKTFTASTSPVVLTFRFKSTNVSSSFQTINLLNGNSTTAFNFIIENGTLNFRSEDNLSLPVATLANNTWYTVKLVAKPGAELAYGDIYVNDELVFPRAGFRTVTDSLDRVRLATGSAGTGNLTVDYVTITSGSVGVTAPTITTQPASQSVAVGGNVTFSIVATGTGNLTYQWNKAGSAISGATSTNYTITNVATTDAGNYTCVVTNTVGNTSANTTSSIATLTVGTILIDENFNAGTVGSAPSGWTTTAPASTTATVVEDPSTTDKSLKLTDTTTTGFADVQKTFTAGSGATTLSFKFKVSNASTGYQTINLRNGSTVAVMLIVENGKLNFRGTNNVSVPVATVAADTWYYVKTVARPASSDADIYFSTTSTFPASPTYANAGFRNAASTLNTVRFATGNAGTGSLSVDNVIVSR